MSAFTCLGLGYPNLQRPHKTAIGIPVNATTDKFQKLCVQRRPIQSSELASELRKSVHSQRVDPRLCGMVQNAYRSGPSRPGRQIHARLGSSVARDSAVSFHSRNADSWNRPWRPASPVDPISTLCHILYEHFGRIGDSQIVELAQKRTAFAKRPDETFEMTVIRFEDLRRKCREATGEQLNWTLEASDLLNVMKIDGRDRIDALRPFGGRPPSTPMQYEEMKLNLRFTIQERQRKHPGTQDQRRSSVQHYAMGSADDR